MVELKLNSEVKKLKTKLDILNNATSEKKNEFKLPMRLTANDVY